MIYPYHFTNNKTNKYEDINNINEFHDYINKLVNIEVLGCIKTIEKIKQFSL